MKIKLIILFILLNSINIYAQKFYLGNYLSPTENEFELIGISTKTGVSTYKYKKEIYDSFFDRKIGDKIRKFEFKIDEYGDYCLMEM